MQGKVEICGINTSKLPVLKNEETMELLRKYRAGDMEAREKLIQGNLRLVLSVIQKFMGRGENADDLFQVGCIGLIKAVENFNVDMGVMFSTYGVPMNDINRNSDATMGDKGRGTAFYQNLYLMSMRSWVMVMVSTTERTAERRSWGVI